MHFLLENLGKVLGVEKSQRRTDQPGQEQKALSEYRICLEQASRLESNIWQTAGLLGIGSIAGLVALAGNSNIPFSAVLVAGVFAINASLVWLRFVRRWGSIQSVQFERMSEIEDQLEFKQSSLVSDRNREAFGHKLYVRKNGNLLQRLLVTVFYRLRFSKDEESELMQLYAQKDDRDRRQIESYEYRGNQPACKLLVVTNVLLWGSYTVYQAFNTLNGPLVSNFVILLIFLVALIVIDIAYWRLP